MAIKDIDELYQRISTDQQQAQEKTSEQIGRVHDSVNEMKVDVAKTNVALDGLKEKVKENSERQRDTNVKLFEKVDSLEGRTAETRERLNSHLRSTQSNPVIKEKSFWTPRVIAAIGTAIGAVIAAIFIGISLLLKDI